MSALEPARERALIGLPSVCDILTVSRAGTATGGWTVSNTTSGEDVPCRVSRVRDRQSDAPSGIDVTLLNAIYLPHGTTCPAGSTIVVGSTSYPVLESTTDFWGLYTVAWCGGGVG